MDAERERGNRFGRLEGGLRQAGGAVLLGACTSANSSGDTLAAGAEATDVRNRRCSRIGGRRGSRARPLRSALIGIDREGSGALADVCRQ